MNKTPVVCKDSPGFIVNRVARHYYLEAMRLVETGKAQVYLLLIALWRHRASKWGRSG
ncbi:3-hydroxyacyl-CoA dehydrogenase family protein [Listeria monocytogenes]|uniref:3-hydroxyacyl-CoA dehydrogenase family protein n=1 Tax=Listeria monocytogenes TaxID=1639 RepID=UPI003AB7E5A8